MQKRKIWGISRWSVSLSFDWTFCKLSQLWEPTSWQPYIVSYILELNETNEAFHTAMFGKGERKKERRCEWKERKKKVQRRYKESWWVQNRKAIHAKVRGILLGQGPRQKLGIERRFGHFNLMIWKDARGRLKGLLKAQFRHRVSKNNIMA